MSLIPLKKITLIGSVKITLNQFLYRVSLGLQITGKIRLLNLFLLSFFEVIELLSLTRKRKYMYKIARIFAKHFFIDLFLWNINCLNAKKMLSSHIFNNHFDTWFFKHLQTDAYKCFLQKDSPYSFNKKQQFWFYFYCKQNKKVKKMIWNLIDNRTFSENNALWFPTT